MSGKKQPITGLLLWGLLSLLGFTVVAWGVTSQFAWVDTLDIYWIDRIQALVSDPLTAIAKSTTVLGDIKLIIVLTVAIASILFVKKRFAEGLWFGGTILLCGVILTTVMKQTFDRDRPEFLQLVEKTNGSFPSGHAIGTALFYGLLGLVILLIAVKAWTKFLTVLVTFLFIMSIMLTRIYLGAHFPTDVVAGICFGLASACISVAVYMIAEEPLRELLHKIKLNDQSRLFTRKRG